MTSPAGFAVPGLSGTDDDVFVFTPTSLGSITTGTYSPMLYFDASAFGLGASQTWSIDLPFE